MDDAIVVDTPGPGIPRSSLAPEASAGIVDEDLERITRKFNAWNNTFKREMLDEFHAVKTALVDRYSRAMEAEHRQLITDLGAANDTVEALKDDFAALKSSASRTQASRDKAVQAFIASREAARAARIKKQVFNEWASQAPWRRRAGWFTRYVAKAQRRMLLRPVIRAWARSVRENKLERNDAFWTEKMKESTDALHSEYEAKLTAMSQELAATRASVQAEMDVKNKYQGQLKKAFMRGVCALNLEAMSLIKAGGLPALLPGAGEDNSGPAPGLLADDGSVDTSTSPEDAIAAWERKLMDSMSLLSSGDIGASAAAPASSDPSSTFRLPGQPRGTQFQDQDAASVLGATGAASRQVHPPRVVKHVHFTTARR